MLTTEPAVGTIYRSNLVLTRSDTWNSGQLDVSIDSCRGRVNSIDVVVLCSDDNIHGALPMRPMKTPAVNMIRAGAERVSL